MSERPEAFCYEDSLIIREKDKAINDLRLLCNEMSRDLAAAKAENARLKRALRAACTPPWPEWTDPETQHVDALMGFYLRQAKGETP